MAETTSIALQHQQNFRTPEQQSESDDSQSQQINNRDQGCYGERERLLVLLGSAISQLPIWGFAMSYGVLQEYFVSKWALHGNKSLTGIIGTTSNGIMYLSMPILFTLFTQKYARYRRTAATIGAILACLSFVLSAFSKDVWHLIITQGILAAFGCALAFSPLTLSLGEWFAPQNRLCNRAVAYGICLSTKNIVGATCPFIFRGLLDHYGFRTTMLTWAGITLLSSLISIAMIQTPSTTLNPQSNDTTRRRKVPWSFLKHRTFWIYAIATLLQSAGYGIPQTYLSEYARTVSLLNPTFSTLLITLINIPGICSSTFFGVLSDNSHLRLSALTVTAISSLASALAAFLFWGLAGQGGTTLLVLFAITFGFFASGYSATWGGVVNDLEQEAARKNEAIDSGVLYGLLNGARGVGYVSGGLVSVPLIKAGSRVGLGESGYETMYGPLIVFTGLSLAFGGWGVMFRPWWKRMVCW